MHRNTSPRNYKTNIDHTKSSERQADYIKVAYLNNTLGDETLAEKKKLFKKKLEVLGIHEKIANRLLKEVSLRSKSKRFRSTGTKFRNSKDQKSSGFMVSKRSINYILKKQAHVIGKTKKI